MKHLKTKWLVLSMASILSVGSAVTVMAADYQSPAEIVASLTGRAVAEVIQERADTGKTFGAIAAEAGKLDEFKAEVYNVKEEMLSEDVENGVMTQEQADSILEDVRERQALCDGTGYGCGAGAGYGCGNGAGFGRGQGGGCGRGAQRGWRNSSCPYNR